MEKKDCYFLVGLMLTPLSAVASDAVGLTSRSGETPYETLNRYYNAATTSANYRDFGVSDGLSPLKCTEVTTAGVITNRERTFALHPGTLVYPASPGAPEHDEYPSGQLLPPVRIPPVPSTSEKYSGKLLYGGAWINEANDPESRCNWASELSYETESALIIEFQAYMTDEGVIDDIVLNPPWYNNKIQLKKSGDYIFYSLSHIDGCNRDTDGYFCWDNSHPVQDAVGYCYR